MDDVAAVVNTVTKRLMPHAMCIIHAGTNNFQAMQSEDFLAKYRWVIRRYNEKSRHITVVGVLPRIDVKTSFYKKTFSVSTRLRKLCNDRWNNFHERSHVFCENDRLH